METVYTALAAHSSWWPDNPLSIAKLEPRLASLIAEKGSLTAALVSLSDNNFSVNVLRQTISLPHFHEQQKLDRPLSRAAMVREVELNLFDEPVVFARSIIPLPLLRRRRNGLIDLGQTPLGHLLFRDGSIRVSKREFTNTIVGKSDVTARRTPYDYQGSQILVSEFFLPSIYRYL